MEKIQDITTILVGVKEIIDGVSGFFDVSISGEYYNALDKLTFLTCKMLGVSATGNISDSARVVGEAICSLCNLVVWGIVLLYLFLILFSYFLSRKVEIPWKIFIRCIIFGVLINAAFFICYFAVYLTENVTEYLIEYCGGKTSFCYLENTISDFKMFIDEEVEEVSIFVMDDLMKITVYILMFLLNVTMGMRFIMLKLLIIFSPIVFAFGCSQVTEKIFFSIGKLFLKLLSYQIVIVVILEIFSTFNFQEDTILRIIIVSTILVGIKFAKKMS